MFLGSPRRVLKNEFNVPKINCLGSLRSGKLPLKVYSTLKPVHLGKTRESYVVSY